MTHSDHETTPVTLELDLKGIPYKFFKHPGQLKSLEQAATERNQHPNQVVRSILFRISEDEFIMVLVAGPRQLSWTKLRKYLKQSRMSMASEDEVMRITGYPLGAVSPFGLSQQLRTLVDKSVLTEDEISIGSGVRNTTIIMRGEDLLRALGDMEVGEYTNEEE
jgi:Cys-tRNA(Pro)/Cys-tRNA(Cys) deacylase